MMNTQPINTKELSKKEQITLNEDRFFAAQKNSDVEQLNELIHDALLFHLPNGEIITKAMDLEAHRSGVMTINSALPSEQQINLIDEDTAVVSVKVKLKGKYIEEPIEATFRYIRVWKLSNDKWKVIAGSCIQLEGK